MAGCAIAAVVARRSNTKTMPRVFIESSSTVVFRANGTTRLARGCFVGVKQCLGHNLLLDVSLRQLLLRIEVGTQKRRDAGLRMSQPAVPEAVREVHDHPDQQPQSEAPPGR